MKIYLENYILTFQIKKIITLQKIIHSVEDNNNEYDNNNNDADDNNRRAFSELSGSDVFSDYDDNYVEDNNPNNNNIDSSDTNTISSNDRSSNNDPFYYDRVLANLNPGVNSELPSYHTYPSQPAPSYKTHSTPILYKSELGDGETFIGNSALQEIDNDSVSDDDSVSTQDIEIEERHMTRIRGGKATRPTFYLIDYYERDLNADRFSQEMMKCVKDIATDSNRSIQIIGTDLINNRITKSYAKKAIDLVHLDSEELKVEVYETEQKC